MTDDQLLARLALFRSTLTMPFMSDGYKGPPGRIGPPLGFRGPSGYKGPLNQWATSSQILNELNSLARVQKDAAKQIAEIEAELARRKEAPGDNKEEGK